MIGKKLCGMMLITNKERNNVATTVEIVTYLRLIKRPNTDSNLWVQLRIVRVFVLTRFRLFQDKITEGSRLRQGQDPA